MATDTDCIIIGAGHNGLVAAWYLVRAGLKVTVLERRGVVGGAAVTEELFPGFRLSVCSYICHMLERKVIDDLQLRRHGLHIYPIDPVSLFPFVDGSHYWAWHDAEKTSQEIGHMQGVPAADADAYPRWIRFWEQAGGLLKKYFLRPAPTVGEIASDVRDTADEAVFDTLRKTSARELAAEYFQDQRVAATAVGSPDYGQISQPGSSLALAYFKTNLHTAHEDLGIVRGGMGSITQAMARSVTSAGAAIHTDAPVKKVVVEQGSVRGVELENGESLSASLVLSNADPKSTFLHLVGESDLHSAFVSQVRSLKTRSASLKFHAALNRLPDFDRFLRPGLDQTSLAMIRVLPSVDAIEASWNDAMSGIPSRSPLMQIQIPSVLDPTLTRSGEHVMSVWVTYQPAHVRNGSWDSVRQNVGEALISELANYAPDIRECIVAWEVFTPEDISRRVAMTDGNIRHLDILPGQMLSDRPLPGWADYRTPIAGLYLCGSGTHPGGEVTGAPGHNAAQAVLARL
jgi:phytoene dehydrogenase-like protein